MLLTLTFVALLAWSEYEAIFKAEKLKYGITPRLTTAERIAQLEQTLENLKAVKQ